MSDPLGLDDCCRYGCENVDKCLQNIGLKRYGVNSAIVRYYKILHSGYVKYSDIGM